ncbi:MAG: hypothetical protein LBR80_06705 [Deltaproteobacteria bacterium]|nr:hypothetical protein [Deltaproteobacteria bacterium]
MPAPLAALSPADGEGGPPPYVRWEFSHPAYHSNGPVIVELFLVSGDGSPLEDASWFYRATNLSSYRSVVESGEAPVLRAGTFEAGPAEGGEFAREARWPAGIFSPVVTEGGRAPSDLRLILSSGGYIKAEVMGAATVRGVRCYAQTAMLLVGDSPGGTRLQSNAADPRWPSLAVGGPGNVYWPQTGETYTLGAPGGSLSGPVWAWRDGGPVPGEFGEAEDGVNFTPAADPELSGHSTAASKPVFFVTGTADGGTLAYTFYVHRPRYAAMDVPLGMGVAAAAFAVTGLGILGCRLVGRRGRHRASAVA